MFAQAGLSQNLVSVWYLSSFNCFLIFPENQLDVSFEGDNCDEIQVFYVYLLI